jgi:hypothetical protein
MSIHVRGLEDRSIDVNKIAYEPQPAGLIPDTSGGYTYVDPHGAVLAYQDVFTTERFTAKIPKTALLRIPGAGHIPIENEPATVARALGEFFAGALRLGEQLFESFSCHSRNSASCGRGRLNPSNKKGESHANTSR